MGPVSAIGRKKGGSRGEGTHREYVDGCPHADFKKLVLPRLGVPFVISPRKLHREAQRMGDLDGAISTPTRRVK